MKMNKQTPLYIICFLYLVFVFVYTNLLNKRDREVDKLYEACAPVVDINNEVICTK